MQPERLQPSLNATQQRPERTSDPTSEKKEPAQEEVTGEVDQPGRAIITQHVSPAADDVVPQSAAVRDRETLTMPPERAYEILRRSKGDPTRVHTQEQVVVEGQGVSTNASNQLVRGSPHQHRLLGHPGPASPAEGPRSSRRKSETRHPRRFVYDDPVSVNRVGTCTPQHAHTALDRAGQQEIICIEPTDELSLGQSQPFRKCIRRTLISFTDGSTEVLPIAVDDVSARVAAATIHDDVLDIPVALQQDGPDRFLQEPSIVEIDRHYRDQRTRCGDVIRRRGPRPT